MLAPGCGRSSPLRTRRNDLGYCIFGFVAGLVLLVLAVAVGGVLIVMKQRKGLHSKKSDNGIFIYAYSKKV